ncbi:MAG: fasciclin domain-containing protein, partial [Methanosarcinaceae archaeon]|nr:fasciclin domain-containing protein [Methanosarcinaceae archaeon]
MTKGNLGLRVIIALFLLLLSAYAVSAADPAAEENNATENNETENNASEELQNIIDTATAENFTSFVTAVKATELNFTLKEAGPFTVFVPTDEAFAALPEETLEALLNDTAALEKVLLYHVANQKLNASELTNLSSIPTLEGSELSVNVTSEGILIEDAKIVTADIQASNGIIHAIDAVMLPPENGEEEENDIVEVATEAGNFSTLLLALETANMTETLKGEGPFTVFAPTDEAFAALPEETLEALLNDTTALEKVLLYHVANQKLNASELTNLSSIP